MLAGGPTVRRLTVTQVMEVRILSCQPKAFELFGDGAKAARVALNHQILVRVQVSDPDRWRSQGARSVVSREGMGSNPIRSAKF